MNEMILQLLWAGIGTFGYCLYIHAHHKHFIAATLGGILSWAVYLAMGMQSENLFLNMLLATIAVYTWSEAMARVMKAPVTVFLAPGIIPLLPGGSLYYTMLALLHQQTESFREYGRVTAVVTMGIACGVVLASIVVSYVITTVSHLKHNM